MSSPDLPAASDDQQHAEPQGAFSPQHDRVLRDPRLTPLPKAASPWDCIPPPRPLVLASTPPLPHWSPRSRDLRKAEIDIELLMFDTERLATSVAAMRADIHLLHDRLAALEDHRSYWGSFMTWLWVQMKEGFHAWRRTLYGGNALTMDAGASADAQSPSEQEERDLAEAVP